MPRGMGNFGVFFPIDNTLYSIAFGTHTKTIEMPFGLMTPVGPRYHVLHGGPAILGENVAAHCKVMGHSTVRCVITDHFRDSTTCLTDVTAFSFTLNIPSMG